MSPTLRTNIKRKVDMHESATRCLWSRAGVMAVLVVACSDPTAPPPKGACLYGPPDIDYKACVWTTREICTEDFLSSEGLSGSWRKGQKCG